MHAGEVGAEPLRSFLFRLAQPTPTPTGGSAIALAAAEAAALLEMVCEIGGRAGSERLLTTATTTRRLGADLLGAVSEDAAAYQAVVRARAHRPEDTDEIQGAIRRATLVPLAVAEKSADLLRLGAAIIEAIRPMTLPDLATAMSLAAAVLAVRVNLQGLTDKDFVKDVQDRIQAAAIATSIGTSTFERAARKLGVTFAAPALDHGVAE